MKMLHCKNCFDHISLRVGSMRKCECGAIAGKYLNDRLNAVVTSNAIVYGIDSNVGFRDSLHYAEIWQKEHPNIRRDFYFTGWVPSLGCAGEVIWVDTVEEVENFDNNYKVVDFNKWGTKPVTE